VKKATQRSVWPILLSCWIKISRRPLLRCKNLETCARLVTPKCKLMRWMKFVVTVRIPNSWCRQHLKNAKSCLLNCITLLLRATNSTLKSYQTSHSNVKSLLKSQFILNYCWRTTNCHMCSSLYILKIKENLSMYFSVESTNSLKRVKIQVTTLM